MVQERKNVIKFHQKIYYKIVNNRRTCVRQQNNCILKHTLPFSLFLLCERIINRSSQCDINIKCVFNNTHSDKLI